MGCLTFWLGRFDDAAQQSLERLFISSSDAFGFGVGNEILEPVGPERFGER